MIIGIDDANAFALAERVSTAMVGFAINRTTSRRIRLDQTRARQSI